MTSLGTYLLICLAFVFFTIAVLALVLLVHENGMRKTGITKEGSKSEHRTQVQKNVGKVSPFEAMKFGLKETGVTQRHQTLFLINRATFFEKLPLARKIDFTAFVMYHFFYLLFNFIYWC